MKIEKKAVILTLSLLISLYSGAQLSGIYTVPGSYSSIGSAISALNTSGVSGAVTINIAAGHTETVTTGGYSLTATGTSVNPIVFQKSGVGANPLITAYVGTATPASATQDGVWRLIGSDYITIDGIDILDPNTTNPATMEFGYALFKADAADGCQYNTIKNCVITLSRVNNVAGSGPSIEGSKGINVINATTQANITVVTVTASSGSNSYNKFYSNTIQNCNVGIALIGYAAASPFTLSDLGNDVGGNSSSTGNTIINFGGGGTAASAGISTLQQRDFNVSYNLLNSNNGTGANHAGIIRGIYLNTAASANASAHNNTITLHGAGTTQAISAIQNVSGSTAASNTISILNNLITNCSYTTATSGAFNGILNSGTPAYLDINNNVVSSTTLSGTGALTGINAAGAISVSITMNSNTVTALIKSGASGSLWCMRAGTSSLTVNGNVITNNSISGNSGTAASNLYGYYNIGAPTFEVYTGNLISNLIIAGSSSSTSHLIYGMYSNTSANSFKSVSQNTVNTLIMANTLAGGSIYGIYQALGNTTEIFKNKIFDLSAGGAAGTVYGIYVNSGATNSVYNNIVGDLRTPAGSSEVSAAGIYFNGGTTANVMYNTVLLNGTSTGSDFGSTAFYTTATPLLTLRNNILNNLSVPTGSGLTTALRTNSASLTSFDPSSNNNSYYAGTPGAANLILYDGTNSVQTLAVYQGAVTPREVNSITENTPFLSLTGSNADFLHINPTLPSLAESGAVNIPGITDDIDGQTRHGNSGYTGTGTAPDIGADEFEQVLPVCSGANAATISAISFSSCEGQNLSLYSTGFSIGSGISHQWRIATTPGGPYTNAAGGVPNHHAYSTSSQSAGVFYYIMVTTCSVGPVSATSNEISFTVNVSPTASITAPAMLCAGENFTLTGGTDIGTSFSWSGPDGFTSTSQSTVITGVSGSAAGVYSFITTYDQCSSPVTTHSLTVNIVTVTISNSDAELCLGNSSTLTANTNGTDYLWSNTSVSNSIVVTPAITTIYTVTATDTNSCSVSATTTVSVTNPTISAMNVIGCMNTTATLSVNAFTPSTVNWYTSQTSTTSLGTGTTFTVSAPATTTMYAQATGAISGSLFTNVAGTSAFIGEMFDVVALNSIVVKGFDVHFTAGTGTVEIWYRAGTHVGNTTSNTGWTLASTTTLVTNGPGALTPVTSTLSIPIPLGQTYAFYIVTNTGPTIRYSTGTLLGSVYAQNSDLQILEGSTGNTYFNVSTSPRAFNGTVLYEVPGCTSVRAPVTLSVAPAPVLVATSTPTNICLGSTATLSASGADTYTWSLNSLNTASITDSPLVTTTYSVEGTSTLTGCSSTETITVGVTPMPTLSIVSSGTAVCTGESATLTASSGAPSYTWNTQAVTVSVVVTPTLTTVYSVSTDVSPCPVVSETINIVVNPLPVISAVASPTAICLGETATLTSTGAFAYLWSTGAIAPSTTVSPAVNMVYSVTGTSTEGCMSSATVAVVSNSLPVVSIAQSDASVCVNSAVTFTASGADSYLWNTTAATSTLLVNPVTATVYTVAGMLNTGCVSTATAGIGVYQLPPVSVSPSGASICEKDSTTLTASGAVSYAWMPSGSILQGITISPSSTTAYTVTGTDANACSNNAIVTVTVNVLPVVSIVGSATICENESTDLTATGAVSYMWLPGNETATVISVSPVSSAVYTLTGTDGNNCSNTATLSLSVDPCTGVSKITRLYESVSLFPNPSTGHVTIRFEVEGNRQVSVLNAIGELVLSQTSDAAEQYVDLSAYAKGLYFIKISSLQSEVTYKVIIQ